MRSRNCLLCRVGTSSTSQTTLSPRFSEKLSRSPSTTTNTRYKVTRRPSDSAHFWEIESDHIVARVLGELIEIWAYKNPRPSPTDASIAQRCRDIVARLGGKLTKPVDPESDFLHRDLSGVSLARLAIDPNVLPILEARFVEARNCLQAKAPLATIFHCGSMLEGMLLGLACANPRQFNEAPNSPKTPNGKVKPFQEWTLAQFIDVASDLGYLKLDVRRFSSRATRISELHSSVSTDDLAVQSGSG